MMLKALLREPLLHFALLGAGLLLAYDHFGAVPDEESHTIVVTRDELLNFVRRRHLIVDLAQSWNDSNGMPSAEELQRLIHDYVREEALYREAKAQRFDEADYLLRARLIEQLEFTMRGFAEADTHISEGDIQRFYAANRFDYRVDSRVSFTHVFFSAALHGMQRAEMLARAEQRKLNQGHVQFEQAPRHGDRFPYGLNYVAATPAEIASDFGSGMQRALFALKPSVSVWHGPLRSAHGTHLILLTSHSPGFVPPLAAVRPRVEQKMRQATADARVERAVQSILSTYKVSVKVKPQDLVFGVGATDPAGIGAAR